MGFAALSPCFTVDFALYCCNNAVIDATSIFAAHQIALGGATISPLRILRRIGPIVRKSNSGTTECCTILSTVGNCRHSVIEPLTPYPYTSSGTCLQGVFVLTECRITVLTTHNHVTRIAAVDADINRLFTIGRQVTQLGRAGRNRADAANHLFSPRVRARRSRLARRKPRALSKSRNQR